MKKVPPKVKIKAERLRIMFDAFGVLKTKEPVKYIRAPKPA